MPLPVASSPVEMLLRTVEAVLLDVAFMTSVELPLIEEKV